MRTLKIIALSLLVAGAVAAGTIKTWSNGEALTASDLNSNMSHIHNLMVGGHGARLVNADVSASAAIATSKLAGYRFMPRAAVILLQANRACGSGASACTETTMGSTSIVGASAGVYTVTLGYTATDATYGVMVTPNNDGTLGETCIAAGLSTTLFVVTCASAANPPAVKDMGFTAVVYDDN